VNDSLGKDWRVVAYVLSISSEIKRALVVITYIKEAIREVEPSQNMIAFAG
jgi:hypothetical protein